MAAVSSLDAGPEGAEILHIHDIGLVENLPRLAGRVPAVEVARGLQQHRAAVGGLRNRVASFTVATVAQLEPLPLALAVGDAPAANAGLISAALMARFSHSIVKAAANATATIFAARSFADFDRNVFMVDLVETMLRTIDTNDVCLEGSV